ncbi:MAG: hypothetical protein NC240_11435 [Clostridium sp.]|nr:hypothetical protein [Clostridium sp.]
MRNNKIILTIMLIFMMFLSSCTTASSDTGENSSEVINTDEASDIDETIGTVEAVDTDEASDTSDLIPATREYFETVNKNYGLASLTKEIGEPTRVTGSGMLYFEWDLMDRSTAKVAFSSDSKIWLIFITSGESQELIYNRSEEGDDNTEMQSTEEGSSEDDLSETQTPNNNTSQATGSTTNNNVRIIHGTYDRKYRW